MASSQTDALTAALIDAANDKSEEVRKAVSGSLQTLGSKKPEQVLIGCSFYLTKHPKLAVNHKIIVLQIMKNVFEVSKGVITVELSKTIISQAMEEMVSSKEFIAEWHEAASDLLVCIGQQYCYEVMEVLLHHFNPGTIPHYYVVHTLASLASVNVYEMVPFLKSTLATLLSAIGSIQSENLKRVCAFAITKFGEAIVEYVANIDQAPDPTVKIAIFAAEFSSVYDILYPWLQAKESKLRLGTVEALGYVSQLMPQEKFDEQVHRLIPAIVSLYKKHPESPSVTQSLFMILELGFQYNSSGLETHVESIMLALFPQICDIPDYSQPTLAKNRHEVLRCFCLMANHYPNTLFQMLSVNMEANSEKSRIGSLIVIRHLVNTANNFVGDKIPKLLPTLKLVVHHNNYKVKQMLVQLIVSLAHHSHLENDNTSFLIDYLIHHCGSSTSKFIESNIESTETFSLLMSWNLKNPTEDGAQVVDENAISFQMICANALYLISTTVSDIDRVLWPHLLQYVIPLKYTSSIGTTCKNAAFFATKMRSSENSTFEIDYRKLSNILHPQTLLARLFVLVGYLKSERQHVLHLMNALVPTFHKNMVATWDAEIPRLLDLLSTGEGNVSEWEKNILELLHRSLNDVDEEEWWRTLGISFVDQISLYSTSAVGKSFLFKCVGEVMKKVNDPQYVREQLLKIFSATQHSLQAEREGCAQAFGRCSVTHLDLVLCTLHNLRKTASTTRKHTGIFSFFVDSKSETEEDHRKLTFVLCYGYVASLAPIASLAPQIETSIIKNVLPYFSAQDLPMQLTLLQVVSLIACAVHPNRSQTTLHPARRQELLQSVLKIMSTADNCDIVNQSLDCVNSLLQLKPYVEKTEKEACLTICLKTVCELMSKHRLENNRMVNAVDRLLELLLRQCPAAETFSFIITSLKPWLVSMKMEDRKQSVHCLTTTVECVLQLISSVGNHLIPFGSMSPVLALLVPRISDNSLAIRKSALTTMASALHLESLLGGYSNNHPEKTTIALEDVLEQLLVKDADVHFAAVQSIGLIVARNLSTLQLVPFSCSLIDGLLDPLPSSSASACVVLNSVVKARGVELHQQVDVILQRLHQQIGLLPHSNARKAALQVVRTLASHHCIAVTNYLLHYHMPYDNSIADFWKILAHDQTLAAIILKHILQIAISDIPTQKQPDPRNSKQTLKLASPQIVAVMVALKELFSQVEMEVCAIEFFNQLFACLLLVCGTLVGSYTESTTNNNKETLILDHRNPPIRVATDAFRAFLLCSGYEGFLDHVSGCWQHFESETDYPDAISCLASSLCQYAPQRLSPVVSHLSSALMSPLKSYRVVTVAFFCELINERCNGDNILLELLLNNLMTGLVDKSNIVRKFCIRGVGHIGGAEQEQVKKHSTTVLSAMITGLDDKDDPKGDIQLEAMNGFSRVLEEIDPTLLTPMLITIVLRIRRCFENLRSDIRAAAFRLFGNLSKFGTGECRSAFMEQIHNNFVALLLHLNDENEAVIQSCKYSLRLIGPLLQCQLLSEMFQKHLIDDAQLHYGDFMNDLSKILVNEFSEKVPLYITTVTVYFKSSWSIIQGNAAMFVGYLLSNLPVKEREHIAKEAVCTALVLLLKSDCNEVRVKAAESLGLLYEY